MGNQHDADGDDEREERFLGIKYPLVMNFSNSSTCCIATFQCGTASYNHEDDSHLSFRLFELTTACCTT